MRPPRPDATGRCWPAGAPGEPLAYLTGEREFWSLPLTVTPGRADSAAGDRARGRALPGAARAPSSRPRVADLGTGIGRHRTGTGGPSGRSGADRPPTASPARCRLRAAMRSAWRRGNVEFLPGRLVRAAGRATLRSDRQQPALRGGAATRRCAALRYEPAVALTPGATGTGGAAALIAQAPASTCAGGWLVLEHGADAGRRRSHALVARRLCSRTLPPRSGRPRPRHRGAAAWDRYEERPWFDSRPHTAASPSSCTTRTRRRPWRISCATSMTASSTAPSFIASCRDSSSRAAASPADFGKKKTHPPVKNEAANGVRNSAARCRWRAPMRSTAPPRSSSSISPTTTFSTSGPGQYGYAVFGRVAEGMDVIDRIAKVPTGPPQGLQRCAAGRRA